MSTECAINLLKSTGVDSDASTILPFVGKVPLSFGQRQMVALALLEGGGPLICPGDDDEGELP